MIKYLLLLLVPLTVYAATTSIKDNTLKLGAKDSQDIYIYADNGSANLPFIFFDFSEGTWKQSNDGITSEVIGGASVVTTEGDLIIGNASGGEVRLPIGTNGKVLTSNGSSATWELPASGDINYIGNYNIENDLSGYLTFDDASAYVNGTGGGVTDTTTTNLTITRNTTTPLRETGDLKLVQGAADSRYEGVSYDFTIDRGQQGQMITCSFWADTSDPNYVDDDIIIIAYDKDNSQIIRVNGEDLKANANPQRHYFQFQAASDADDYRVSWMVNQSNTNGYTIYLDQIACSPTRLARGAIVTEWQSFTPSFTGVSITNNGSRYYRVGQFAHIFIDISASADATSTVQFDLSQTPFTIDTSSLSTRQSFGAGSTLTGSTYYGVSAIYDGAIEFKVDSTGGSLGNTHPSAEGGFDSGDRLLIYFTVPIQGWEAEGTLAEELGGGNVVAHYRGSAATSLSATPAIIKYTTEISDTTNSYDSSTGLFTAPESGYYDIDAGYACGVIATAANQTATIYVYIDGSEYAYRVQRSFNAQDFNQPIINLNALWLNKGQTVSVYGSSTIGASRTTGTATTYQYISVKKSATGSQKFETATVAARYTSNAGQSWVNAGYLDYEDIDYDTHGAYDTSTGEYTVPISGKYIVSASGMCDSEAWLDGYVLGLNIVVNGSATTQSLHYTAAMTSNLYTSVRDTLDLAKGDVIEVQASTNISTNMNTQSKRNVFSIIRIK